MAQLYSLSPNYELSLVEKKDTETIFLLADHSINETYTINEIIFTFLSFFKKPTSFFQSVDLFANAFESNKEDVLQTVNTFFGDMFHKSILIKNEEYEHLVKQKEVENDLNGTYLRDFDIKKVLSKSDYLSIILVENKESSVKSIFKVLHLKHFFSEEAKRNHTKAFRQEAKIHKKAATHEGIVSFLDFKTTRKFVYLQIAFAEGESLSKFIVHNPQLSLESRKILAQNILSAYAHLHQLDLIHGDIHGNNIIVNSDLSIKIIDFDMSYHNTPIRRELVSKGGIQEYIAPENISQSALHISKRRSTLPSEVHQLGVILYFIFFAKLPFEADTWSILAKKIKKQEPIFDIELPQNIILFLQKAMQKKAKERFSSAIEMLEEWNKKAFTNE